ncbi:MAG: SusC/RagA family TonB-linked outer membrane protein [Sphingobacteriaceae bacterium]|nr:MAG: SusC/RagA family TonB-linked outer membrane protein [Sphingobacteriaceae bacterium]
MNYYLQTNHKMFRFKKIVLLQFVIAASFTGAAYASNRIALNSGTCNNIFKVDNENNLLKEASAKTGFNFVLAQADVVRGKVTDEKGEALIGVSVKLKDSAVGAATDYNGNFSITIPASSTNAVLVISYLGFVTQEVPVAGRTSMTILLKANIKNLEEVVVVGYNTVKKSDVTGAVVSVTAADIRSRPVSNALEAMQGKAAGVDITSNERPGQIGSVLIRGARSLTAGNSPLYVVDGIPLSYGGIEAINPNDIETIDVLKDASATAIYGSRGANGVILVTTKRGKAGRLSLDYVGTTTIEKINTRTEMMNSAQYIEFRRDAYRRIGYLNPAANANSTYPAVPTLADDRRILGQDAVAFANIEKGWQNGTFDGSLVPTTDWTGMVEKTGVTQNHTLSASGGTDKIRAYGSFGFLSQGGTQLGQDYTRYNSKFSIDISPVKWFSMGGSVTATYSTQNYGFQTANVTGPGNLYFAAQAMLPFAVPFNSNGSRINLPGGDINILNPIGEDRYNINLRKVLRTIGSLYAEFNIAKGLKYRVNFGPDFYNFNNGRWQDANSINRGGGEPGSTNYAQLNQSSRFSWNLDHLLYYDKTAGKHNFGATFLYSSTANREETSTMTATKLPWNNQLWYQLNSVSALDAFGTNLVQSALLSYMGRINYSFNSKYLLTASARWDGASQLAAGHKWDFFPSAALAWRMEQEDFIRNVSWIDQLKLRIGVGSTGNAAVSPYQTLGALQTLYYTYGSSVQAGYVSSDASLSNPTPLPNVELGWEHTAQYNLGLDFAIYKGRLSGSLETYTSKTTGLLVNARIPTVNGYTSSYQNIGATANRGIELTLNTENIKGKNFRWSSTLNFAANKERITALPNGNDLNNLWFIGQRIAVYYDYVKDRIWQNTAEDKVEIDKFRANG